MSSHTTLFRIVYGGMALFASLALLVALDLSFKSVRVETKVVQADPGKPDATIPGEQINPQLKGTTCDVWQTSSSVTFVCRP